MINNDRFRFVLRTSMALVFGSVLFIHVASAQPATTTTIPPGHWTLTPYVGTAFSGDLDSGTWDIGASGGYVWSPRLSFEADFNFLPQPELNGLVELNSTVYSVTGNVLYHFSGRRWVPYGVAGIGFGHSSVDVPPNDPAFANVDDSSTEFVGDIGGGVERALNNLTAFRGDFRYMFGGNLVPDYWRLTFGVTLGFNAR